MFRIAGECRKRSKKDWLNAGLGALGHHASELQAMGMGSFGGSSSRDASYQSYGLPTSVSTLALLSRKSGRLPVGPARRCRNPTSPTISRKVVVGDVERA